MPNLTHSIRLLRPIRAVARAKLLGESRNGIVVQRTDDKTPELVFRWRGTPPTTITLKNSGTGATYGPFPVFGTGSNVTIPLPFGMYIVSSQALNGQGVLDQITGALVIEGSSFSVGFTLGFVS